MCAVHSASQGEVNVYSLGWVTSDEVVQSTSWSEVVKSGDVSNKRSKKVGGFEEEEEK